jgi:hypothetical protein
MPTSTTSGRATPYAGPLITTSATAYSPLTSIWIARPKSGVAPAARSIRRGSTTATWVSDDRCLGSGLGASTTSHGFHVSTPARHVDASTGVNDDRRGDDGLVAANGGGGVSNLVVASLLDLWVIDADLAR